MIETESLAVAFSLLWRSTSASDKLALWDITHIVLVTPGWARCWRTPLSHIISSRQGMVAEHLMQRVCKVRVVAQPLPATSGRWSTLLQLHSCIVCWLLNVPATCKCISGTGLLRQLYVLPHWDRSCRPNFLPHPVTVYWHRADQSQH